MPKASIKRVKVTGWHEDKDTGDNLARLKITFEGRNEEKISGKMYAYLPKWQLDEWAMALVEREGVEGTITLDDLHDELFAWLFTAENDT